MKTRLAFYKGTRAENPNSLIGDWLICLVTHSRYSHAELVVANGYACSMLSSSIRDKGVREVHKVLDPKSWIIVEFDKDPTDAIAYIRSRIGTPYGWLDLLSFLLPFRVST